MKVKTDPRNKAVYMRFTRQEFEFIEKRFKNSTCRKFSEYGRKILLDEPVTFNQRNASLDELMIELIQLRKQLVAIADRFDQAIKKLNFSRSDQASDCMPLYEAEQKAMFDQIRTIHEYISQTGKKWLQ